MKIKLAILIILTFAGVARAVESNYTQAEELGFKYVKAMDESEYQTHQRRELQEAESREQMSNPYRIYESTVVYGPAVIKIKQDIREIIVSSGSVVIVRTAKP